MIKFAALNATEEDSSGFYLFMFRFLCECSYCYVTESDAGRM
jgi:hypothetical protein